MGELLLSLIVVVYLLYGLYAFRREIGKSVVMSFIIIIKNQKENIEGIIRFIAGRIKKVIKNRVRS